MRIRIPSLRTLALSAILGTFFLFACQVGEEEKVEATISFNQIFDSLVQYDSVIISLKDKQGTTIDVVFDGKVKIPGDLEKRPAPHWDGGTITVSILGYKGGTLVHRSETSFTGTNNKKDSVYVYISPDVGIASLLRTIPMREGDSIDLPAITITPPNLKNKDLVWSSSAPDVIRIGATGFKALKSGNSQITVALSSDATKTLTIVITVVEPAKIPDSLYLSAQDLNLIAGSAPGRLDVNFVPSTAAKEVIWSTLDTTIATVSADGSVQGKKAGETRLIVVSSLKASVNDTALIVVSSPKPPERVVFAKDETEIFQGGAAESLLVSILPPEAIQDVDFTVTTPLLIELKNGRITGSGEGYGEVIAKSRVNSLLADTLKVKISLKHVINSVTLSKKTLLVFTGGDEPVLSAVVDPSTSNPKVQWRANPPGIAKVSDSGKVTGLVPGHTRIYAISLADSTRRDSAEITVKTDLPIVNIGRPDTTVSVGATVTVLPVVPVQEFGIITAFRWDIDGLAGWDDSAKVVQAVTIKFDLEKEYTLRFYVRDSEGNETIAIKKVSAVIGPVVTIISPVDGAYFTNQALKIEWKIDNVLQTTGTDTLLKEGANTITRSAKDAAGKVFSTAVTVYFDTVPPIKPSVKGPGGNINGKPTWTWSPGGGGNGTYRIAVDSQVFTRPESKDTLYIPDLALAEGLHTLYVQERDAAGNWSVSGSIVTRVDRTGPTKPIVKINSTSPSKEKKPVWSWTTGGGGFGLFQYKFGSTDFTSGASTPSDDVQFIPATNLGDGLHTLYVRERDSLGNWSELGNAAITIDTTPPGGPKILATTPTSAAPKWTWTSGGGGNGTYRYKVGGEPSATPESALTEYELSGAVSKTTYTLHVQERDSAGNWSTISTQAVLFDLEKPTVTITTPVAQTTGMYLTKLATVDLAGTSTSPQGAGSMKSITYTVDGVAGILSTNMDATGKWSIKALPLTNNKTIVVKITATDAANNTGEATLNILMDNTAPVAPTFTAQPPAIIPKTDTRTSLDWTWNQPAGTDSFVVKLNGTEVARQVGTTHTVTTISDGTYLLEVSGKDMTGNASAFKASTTVLVDRISPTGPNLSQPATPRRTAQWTWTSGGGGNGSYQCLLDGATTPTACTSPFNLPSPTDGDHILRVRELDAAGNSSAYSSTTVTIDLQKPSIANSNYINVMDRVFNTIKTFTGTASDERGLKTVTYQVDDGNPISTTGTQNWFFKPSLSDGTHTLRIVATDNADNADTIKMLIAFKPEVKFVRKGAMGSGTSWNDAVGELWTLLEPHITYSSGDQVWVTEGTYAPNASLEGFHSPDNLGIYGGFSNQGTDLSVEGRSISSHPTILEGRGSDYDFAIIKNVPPSSSTIRDNFTWDGFSIISEPPGLVIKIDGTSTGPNAIAFNNFFIGNYTDSKGQPSIVQWGGHVSMKNFHLTNIYSPGSSQIFKIWGRGNPTSLTCDECHFNNNSLETDNGTILSIEEATVDFKNSTITNKTNPATAATVVVSVFGTLKYQESTTTIDKIISPSGTVIPY